MSATGDVEGRGRFTPREVVTVLLVAGIATLFGVHVARHAFVSDDCFISLIYARSLIEGDGLVYLGEKVEGYTNFLWVLLAACAMWVELDPGTVLNTIGIASGAGILLLLAGIGARTSSWRDPGIWIAPACPASPCSGTSSFDPCPLLPSEW